MMSDITTDFDQDRFDWNSFPQSNSEMVEIDDDSVRRSMVAESSSDEIMMEFLG